MAAINDQLATADLLIKHGATIDGQDNAQKTPFLLAINNGILRHIQVIKYSTESMCHFIPSGNSDVADLLIKHGATIKNLELNANDGMPIMHWAAEKGYFV